MDSIHIVIHENDETVEIHSWTRVDFSNPPAYVQEVEEIHESELAPVLRKLILNQTHYTISLR